MVLYAVPECQSESNQELYVRRNWLFPGYGDFYNVSMTVYTNTTELILHVLYKRSTHCVRELSQKSIGRHHDGPRKL